jgi:hypothetical protein
LSDGAGDEMRKKEWNILIKWSSQTFAFSRHFLKIPANF